MSEIPIVISATLAFMVIAFIIRTLFNDYDEDYIDDEDYIFDDFYSLKGNHNEHYK